MSRVSAEAKSGYERLNALWQAQPVPSLTGSQAEWAGRRLIREFLGETFEGRVRISSGNRISWVYDQGGDALLIVNPARGWRSLVHDLSHALHRRRSRKRPHGAEHAMLELRMVRYVIESGWLAGEGLVPAPRQPSVRQPRSKPDPLAIEQVRIAAAVKRWTTKARRATTALAQLARRQKRLDRALAKRDQTQVAQAAA